VARNREGRKIFSGEVIRKCAGRAGAGLECRRERVATAGLINGGDGGRSEE
jgi:hypothetical protein